MSIDAYRIMLSVSVSINVLLFSLFMGALDSRKFWIENSTRVMRMALKLHSGSEQEKEK
jgi:hypothetical protein